MELNRLQRVIRERWWVVASLAAIGFVTAFGFTTLGNQNLDVTYEAIIPLRFDPEEGESLQELSTEITDAGELAILAADEYLSEYPGSSIFPDTSSGRLLFIARGDTRDEALTRADDLITAYFEADPIAGGDLEAQLSLLEQQAIDVAEQIEDLQPVLTAEEQQLLYEHEVLDRSIVSIRDQLVALTVADATASEAEREENEEARRGLDEALQSLVIRKAALPPPPSQELSTAEQLQLDALTRRLDLLTTEYQALSLRAVGITRGETRETASLSDLTPRPASPLLNGLIGLVVGAGSAAFALIAITRVRQEVWLPDDVPVPVLEEIPERKLSQVPGPTWYDATHGGARKEAIQTTRTALDGFLSQEAAVLAIAGDHVGPDATKALAADLAGSFASAGRSVLLIDADYSDKADLTEYDVGEPSLSSILQTVSAPGSESEAHRLLEDVVFLRPDLAVVPTGDTPSSPADALAGRGFRLFLDAAQLEFDTVIVVAGDSHTATTQVITQRVGTALIAIAPGKTTVPGINAVLADLMQQRVDLPGIVMLRGSESRSVIRKKRTSITPESRIATSPPGLSRLGSYPFPSEKRIVNRTEGSLRGLQRGLEVPDSQMRAAAVNEFVDEKKPHTESQALSGQDSVDDPLGGEVLDALRSTDAEKGYERVAAYMVARIEDMATAVPGQESISSDLIDKVSSSGFIPITPVKGHPSIGHWLSRELEVEVGLETSKSIVVEFVRILGGDTGDPIGALDSWISTEFFPRHIRRTDGEPEIWQIGSSRGSVELLIAGRKLTEHRLREIITEVVRRKIDELERTRTLVVSDGDGEMVNHIDEALRDVHDFEIVLSQLLGGIREEARLIYPWRSPSSQPQGWSPVWSEGIKPNIAPLQRLGLLSYPVLSEDELKTLVPA